MPERCSPARVRYPAPNIGALLPAARRSRLKQSRRAAPAGTRSENEIRFYEPHGLSVEKRRGVYTKFLTMPNRGVQDILIACVDGLRGFPDAIATVYPKTQVQLCIVHLMRNSLNFVSWKERKTLAST